MSLSISIISTCHSPTSQIPSSTLYSILSPSQSHAHVGGSMYRVIRSSSRTCNSIRHLRTLVVLNPSIMLSTASGPSSVSAQNRSTNRSHDFKAEEVPRFNNPSSTAGRHNGTGYQDEQSRVLQASLPLVGRMGWTEGAMIAGAREVGLSPSIVGSFPRKEAALVEFFMDECLQRLIDLIDSDKELKNLVPSDRISKLVKTRLEMQAPYISKWPQALSIQAQPLNVPTSFKQRAMLVDEIWHASGDENSDVDWYVKRTILGGIYSTTEIYMLTDNSPDFRDTWAFLENRVKDAFDLKKTMLEAKYLAEAVGAGMGSSLQGFMKNVFRGSG